MAETAYNFGNKDNTSSVSTSEGTITTTLFNNNVVKQGVKKILNAQGEVVATYNGRITVPSITGTPEVVTKPVNRTTRTGIDGVVYNSDTASSIDTWHAGNAAGTPENYKKNDAGVVMNVSKDDYTAAREAKKKRVAEQKAKEENENALQVLKNEVPIDIEELKSLVNILLAKNGLVVNEATDDEINAADKQAAIVLIATKGELFNYVKSTLLMNGKDAVTAGKRFIRYSDIDLSNTFELNNSLDKRSNEEYASHITVFIQKLIDDNTLAIPPGLAIPTWENDDKTMEYIEGVKNYFKDLFDSNGFKTPDIKEATTGWMQDLLDQHTAKVDEKVTKTEEKVEEISTKVDSVTNKVNTLDGKIDTTKNELQGSIQAVSTKVTKTESDISDIKSTLQAIQQSLQTIQTATNKISTIQSDIANLKQRVTTLEGKH